MGTKSGDDRQGLAIGGKWKKQMYKFAIKKNQKNKLTQKEKAIKQQSTLLKLIIFIVVLVAFWQLPAPSCCWGLS